MNTIEFTKMHGAGNDYIYVDAARFPIAHPEAIARAWSDRNTGIGADGVVLITPSQKADFGMRMFNSDGSEGRMCGNAARCIGRYVYTHGLTSKRDITLETLSGIKALHLYGEGREVSAVLVDMGVPALVDETQFLPQQEAEFIPGMWRGHFVSMGNPHYVIFVPDVAAVAVDVIGPQLEKAACFPRKANIEFVQELPDGSLRMRVWERGSGITLACGTGACATAVAAQQYKGKPNTLRVRMDGGEVTVACEGGRVLLTGPATEVFTGRISMED